MIYKKGDRVLYCGTVWRVVSYVPHNGYKLRSLNGKCLASYVRPERIEAIVPSESLIDICNSLQGGYTH